MTFSYRFLKYCAGLWLFIVIACGYYLSQQFSLGKINTSILELLPKQSRDHLPEELINTFHQRLDSQIMWLIHSPKGNTEQAATWWQSNLTALSPYFISVRGIYSKNEQQQLTDFIFKYRQLMIDPQTSERLENNQQANFILSQLYSPFSGVSASELAYDPLLLIRGFQLSANERFSKIKIDNNWLSAHDEQNQRWIIIHGQLTNSVYDIYNTEQLVQQLTLLKQQFYEKWPDAEILERGSLFHSYMGKKLAEEDITTIGLFSLIAIVLLILIIFRSIKPLFLTLISISIGCLMGASAVLFFFNQIHVMTLVMSTTIIGLSVDYALHYLCERLNHSQHESSLVSLNKLFSTLFFALFTSLTAYSILYMMPFPGVRQLAVFAIFGLLSACMTVIFWYPLLIKRLIFKPSEQLNQLVLWGLERQKSRKGKILIISLITMMSLYGISKIHINDDIALLQPIDESIRYQEKKIAQISGDYASQTWFVITGEHAEQTLVRAENLYTQLNKTIKQGAKIEYLPLLLPSMKKQQANFALIERSAPMIFEQLKAYQIGTNYSHEKTPLITPELWFSTLLGDSSKPLWYQTENGLHALLVPIRFVEKDQATLEAIHALSQQLEGITYMDRRADFSALFSLYRDYLSYFLICTVLLVYLLFIIRFGFIHGSRCLIPTVLSLMAGLSLLGYTQQPLNLFSLLALVLVLGVGIDYSLFFANHKVSASTTMLSVFTAALTTLLSFGLLTLSHTYAIAGFGLVISGGILTAFILSPLAIKQKTKEDRHA